MAAGADLGVFGVECLRGCGETPYIKLVTQLFGDRMIIANATGCTSIYGGNLPTTPYTQNSDGRGPAWSNSLFEDNAEFGMGFRMSIDKQREFASELLQKLAPQVGDDLVRRFSPPTRKTKRAFTTQRDTGSALKPKLQSLNTASSAIVADGGGYARKKERLDLRR